MPFTDSRLGPGTLTLGTPGPGTEYGFQVAALALTPAVNETTGTPTLAVPAPAPEMQTDYTLDGDAINDFGAVTGLQRYCYDHDSETVDFVWTPNTDETPPAVLTGQVQLRAFPMGGKVGEQLVTSFSWPTVDKPVWSGGAPLATAAAGKK
jgi:hypothetical protein